VEIVEDVTEEVSKHGQVLSLVIPRPQVGREGGREEGRAEGERRVLDARSSYGIAKHRPDFIHFQLVLAHLSSPPLSPTLQPSGPPSPAVGKIFVEYADSASTQKAAQALQGRRFAGRTVQVRNGREGGKGEREGGREGRSFVYTSYQHLAYLFSLLPLLPVPSRPPSTTKRSSEIKIWPKQ
jgi:hypothetical protein